MKRTLLLLLMAVPLLSMAQQAITPTKETIVPHKGIEICLNGGLAVRTLSTHYPFGNSFGGTFANNISVLHNKNKIQYGFGVDVNVMPYEYWELQPHVVVNRLFVAKRSYFYAGAMLGYANRQNADFFHYDYVHNTSHGYVFGLQGGIVYCIGKLALNAELALRSTQYWNKERVYIEQLDADPFLYLKPINIFEVSLPVKIGVRYRF